MEEHPAVAGADVSGIVRQWNQYIPASAPHKREQIYIREAYPTYYDYIHQAFDLGYLKITLTGSSGIGTSCFYSYFLTGLGRRTQMLRLSRLRSIPDGSSFLA
jgi:hypothetical protein